MPVASAILALITLATLEIQAADSSGEGALAQRLDGVLSEPSLRGAKVAALVVRESDGQPLYSHNPDEALIPASNAKILTALVALDTFGPTHQFETLVRSASSPDSSGGVESVALIGGGDPVLNSEDWWRLAADLRRSGLLHIRGDILIDDSAFDSSFWHPDWGKVSARAYYAPVGALTANYGAYFVRVGPGVKPGEPAAVMVDPPIPYLKLDNRAVTGGKTAKPSLMVDRDVSKPGVERVLVSGAVRVGSAASNVPRSVADPGLYAGEVFKMQLLANGIRVDGDVVRAGCSPCSRELIRFKGRPLSEIVRLFMKYSNNSIAESLLKSIGSKSSGGQGSWATGLAAMRQRLAALGLAGQGMRLVDGSGLSPRNRLSPRILTDALLIGQRSFRFGPELRVALPMAARDGTLEKRAAGVIDQVRAKTGLLQDARATALSGFAHLRSGERVVFSILVNGYRGGSWEAMSALDRWLAALVGETR